MTTTRNEFALPDVGEGLTEAELVKWHVSVGDTVRVNDVLCEVETAKAVVELPSPVDGVIGALCVAEGETVPVGTVLVTFGQEAASDAVPESVTAPEPDEQAPTVLVGSGPRAPGARRRHLRPRGGRGTPRPAPGGSDRPRAAPPVRKLARTLGVDLAALAAEAPGGVVTRTAVERAAHAKTPAAQAEPPRETRVPITGVRRATAAAMTRSVFTAPHVTEWLTVDVTATMDLVAALKRDRDWTGVRVTPLLLVAKAFLLAIRRYPEINSRWDEENQEIVRQHYVNLGIAAATPRGLVVPNIKEAHRLDLAGLAAALDRLVTAARAGTTPPADMTGGTITITNIGAFGVDAGTPILNPGEAAILAFGAVRPMPWVVDGEIRVRQVTQLALSFDHRLVDGELGSHVLAEVGRILHDPARAILHV